MEKHRTTDLFRFVKLRAPQIIADARKKLGFVEHPNPEDSEFLSAVARLNNSTQTKETLVQVATDFSPFENVTEIKNLLPDFWEFALWLSQNKNSLDRSILDAKVPATDLAPRTLIQLWDNVYYDLIRDRNPYIREACLLLIVAQNFKEKYLIYSPGTTLDAEEQAVEQTLLQRLANGKVMINQAFVSEQLPYEALASVHSAGSALKQEVQHKAHCAGLMIPVLEGMKEELLQLNKTYTKDFNAAFDSELTTYKASVDTAIASYESAENTSRTSTDTSTAVNSEAGIPEGAIPAFEFDFAPPLAAAYISDKVSPTTQTYVLGNRLEDQAIEGAIDRLEQQIESAKKDAAKVAQKKFKYIAVNGIPIQPRASQQYRYALSFDKVQFGAGQGAKSDIHFSLAVGYDNAFIEDETFSLTVNNLPVAIQLAELKAVKNDSVFLKLTAAPIAIAPGKPFVFEATFTLDNGQTLAIKKKGFTTDKAHTITSGFAEVTSSTNATTPLYGVNRIGVADYLRVEQELCCYVPGEVSHIENIMAREYKERATRSLTRSERSTESSTERELEESNDTTSTSRHELSSEVSEVLQKDRRANVGFSAGTRGDYSKISFTAGVHGDFSFGRASTNSNAVARNYAEDVTRRALERVIQKTSLRRTSTVIKEFEDQNKHGFDNREGTKHVTGVFRWIDKVYRNRVVNYGRRLVYEFMLPEPARFYKNAIIEQAEAENTTARIDQTAASVLVKPTHPKEHGINDSTDISRSKYKHFASLYNITVQAPEEEIARITSSYSEAPGGKDAAMSFKNYQPLRVPPGYSCFEIETPIAFNYKANWGAKAYIKTSIGGRNWEVKDLKGEGSVQTNHIHEELHIIDAVPVVVNTKKITSFNLSVTVKCRLKANIYEQWQQDVYGAIIDAYESQLRTYNEALAREKEEAEQLAEAEEAATDPKPSNPRFNAQIINTELKRMCIEMLTKPFGIEQGKNYYREGSCEVPEMKLGKSLDAYGSTIKFFEQAFDWQILSQLFYPYYWADKCDWKELFQSKASNDHTFQAFLQAGMGRVLVPVKEGFEDAVTFYMETGKIWNGSGMVMETDDDLYVSIVDEVTQAGGVIEGEEWETIVPTTLTIVQAKSALLQEEGLPCCETDQAVIDQLNIKADTNILTAKGDTPA